MSKDIPSIQTDVLVIGSGVAGLRAAIEAAKYADVLIATKDKIHESSTFYAQGGIAVVLSPKDTYEQHIKDTLKVGQELSLEEAVRVLVEEGPLRVKELIQWGAEFDKENGDLLFTKESGHSVRRIIHARGDATGAEIERVLIQQIKAWNNIKILEHTFAIDLLSREGECFGAIVQLKGKAKTAIFAKKTILATGGMGQIYRETTNPIVATGDGVAMAYRAGAVIRDMEFVQFHPTTLYIAGASRFLISETVRGEGGILRNIHKERFMERYHKMAELADRDVVSRSILEEMKRTEAPYVYLDLTHLDPDFLEKRFPNIVRVCSSFGIDIKRDLIPVRPACHYMIGGVKIDLWGRTNIENLYACGEVASSGVHGANRLPSNSLLEGLVFGCRSGSHAGESAKKVPRQKVKLPDLLKYKVSRELDIEDVKNSLKSLMERNVGIERDEKRLLEASNRIRFWSSYVLNRKFLSREGWELQNMLTVTHLVQKGALERRESRGVHYRKDYPKKDPQFKRHTESKIEMDIQKDLTNGKIYGI